MKKDKKKKGNINKYMDAESLSDSMNIMIEEVLKKSINQSEFKWRTARGISKDSNLSLLLVKKILDSSDEVVKAKIPNSGGHALFSTTEHLKEKSGLIARFLAAMKNEVPS